MARAPRDDSKLLDAFEAAVRDHEMLGAHPPEDHERIERRYRETRLKLLRRLFVRNHGNDYAPEGGTA